MVHIQSVQSFVQVGIKIADELKLKRDTTHWMSYLQCFDNK